MYDVCKASLNVIARKFPERSFINTVPLRNTIGLYVLLMVLGFIELFLTQEEGGGSFVADLGYTSIIQILSLLATLWVSMLILNRYASEKFSLQQVFTLTVVLTFGAGFLMSIIGIVFSFVGEEGMAIAGIMFLVFSIYMLLTLQAAVSKIALITKSQAAYVVLAPLLISMLVWGMFAGSMLGTAF